MQIQSIPQPVISYHHNSGERKSTPQPFISYHHTIPGGRKPSYDSLTIHGGHSHRLVLSHMLLTAFTFVCTYLLSYYGFNTHLSNHPLQIPPRQINITDFHLSTSLDYGLSRCIGALILPIAGVGFVLIATWRFFFVLAKLPSRRGSKSLFPHKRNNLSLLSSIGGAGGFIGVGAFPSVVHKPLHFFFAFIAFTNVCFFMLLNVHLDRSLKLYLLNKTEKVLHYIRIILSLISIISLLGMVVSMKVMKDKVMSSTFELILAGSWMGFICTFGNQLKYVKICISAKLNEKDCLEIAVDDVDDDDGDGNTVLDDVGDDDGDMKYQFSKDWADDVNAKKWQRERAGSEPTKLSFKMKKDF